MLDRVFMKCALSQTQQVGLEVRQGRPYNPNNFFQKLWLGKPNQKAKADSNNGKFSCASEKHFKGRW